MRLSGRVSTDLAAASCEWFSGGRFGADIFFGNTTFVSGFGSTSWPRRRW
jgi:hypothetical protein